MLSKHSPYRGNSVSPKLTCNEKWDEQFFRTGETNPMKTSPQHLIAEVPRRQPKVEMTIGIDLGDVCSQARTRGCQT